jgi:hypothetical protein
MTALPAAQPVDLTRFRRRGQAPAPTAWTDHRTRTVALDGWLAREAAVAAGAAAAVDPVRLGLPDRETLLRTLFQRFTTTLEGVLDNALELGEDRAPQAAVRTAYLRAAAHRPADWRALQREAADPLVAELTRRQHARMASRAGIGALEVARVAAEVAGGESAVALAPRSRRRRTPRIVARRAG